MKWFPIGTPFPMMQCGPGVGGAAWPRPPPRAAAAADELSREATAPFVGQREREGNLTEAPGVASNVINLNTGERMRNGSRE